MTRTAFFISDGTGITAEALGNSLLAQFGSIQFKKVTLPYVDSIEKAVAAVDMIDQVMLEDGQRPIVFDTVVDEATREIISTSGAYKIDVFSAFLKPLELELGSHSSYSVGKSHAINEVTSYMDRIESVNFAIDNDDGARTQHYHKADIILTGVSRCGKTPSCLYMALQFGVRAANYPLTDQDLTSHQLPEAILPYRDKLYGLTIDPFQLASIRHERRANSRYSSLDQCEDEVRNVERMFREEKLPHINTTHFSIEEIATRIMAERGLERRIN
jgi:regulator of PEP synthase PpsR (kinase-PPPase family)